MSTEKLIEPKSTVNYIIYKYGIKKQIVHQNFEWLAKS